METKTNFIESESFPLNSNKIDTDKLKPTMRTVSLSASPVSVLLKFFKSESSLGRENVVVPLVVESDDPDPLTLRNNYKFLNASISFFNLQLHRDKRFIVYTVRL